MSDKNVAQLSLYKCTHLSFTQVQLLFSSFDLEWTSTDT